MVMQQSLAERNRKLLKDGILSDVTFIVGKAQERIAAHKGILASSSPVFCLQFTQATEGETEIHIPDDTPSSFKTLLEFIYTDEEPEIDSNNWAPLLKVSYKYRLPSLQAKCKSFVEKNILTINAFKLFCEARKYQVQKHVPFLIKLIAYHADKSLSSDSILDIEDKESLAEILSFDKLNCDEILVYRAAIRWASAQIQSEQKDGGEIRRVLGEAFYSIRFTLISCDKLYDEVIPKNVLKDDELIYIIKKMDSGPFNTNSRVRICDRFNDQKVSTLKTNDHAIQFSVNQAIKIYGFLVNTPHDESVNELCGKIILKDHMGCVLGEKSFDIKYNSMLKSIVISFEDPVNILPKTNYVASVHFDSNNFTTEMGINGQSKVVVDGVEWKFVNDSSSTETNMSEGQIPSIEFSK